MTQPGTWRLGLQGVVTLMLHVPILGVLLVGS